MNDEQREAHAVDVLKSYTSDIYVGPDVETESLEQMAAAFPVYLKPVQHSTRRVVVGMLRSLEHMTEISRELIPLCYAIGWASGRKTANGNIVVKWYNITAVNE